MIIFTPNSIIKSADVNLNNSGLADGSLINDDVISDDKLIYGKIRGRQGGSSTVWNTKGTTNYDLSATNTFIQCGAIGLSTEGTNVTVTFPTAFTYAPVVVCQIATAISINVFAEVTSISASTFTVRAILGNGSAEAITWIAIGE